MSLVAWCGSNKVLRGDLLEAGQCSKWSCEDVWAKYCGERAHSTISIRLCMRWPTWYVESLSVSTEFSWVRSQALCDSTKTSGLFSLSIHHRTEVNTIVRSH